MWRQETFDKFKRIASVITTTFVKSHLNAPPGGWSSHFIPILMLTITKLSFQLTSFTRFSPIMGTWQISPCKACAGTCPVATSKTITINSMCSKVGPDVLSIRTSCAKNKQLRHKFWIRWEQPQLLILIFQYPRTYRNATAASSASAPSSVACSLQWSVSVVF